MARDTLLAQLARKIVAIEAGSGNEDEPALGVARACEKLAGHMANLVGAAGIHALFDRSLAIARGEFPWLVAAVAVPPDDRWRRLQICMESQDPAIANDAAEFLIETFLALIGRFIGTTLVRRLLAEMWPELSSPPEESK